MDSSKQQREQQWREQAEAIAAQQRATGYPDTLPDLQTLVHQLQVYQIELELQNDELQRTQHALQLSRDAYADLYEFAPVGYFTVDSTGRICDANATGATMLGVTKPALLHQPLAQFVLPDDQDILYMHRLRLARTDAPQSSELRLQRSDGTIFHAHLTSTAAPVDTEDPTFRVVVVDVTERVKAQAELQQTHAELKQQIRSYRAELAERKRITEDLRWTQISLDGSTECICHIGAQGQFLYVNAAMCATLGYSHDELLRLTISDVDPHFPPHVWAERWQEHKQNPSMTFETTHRCKDGQLLPVEVTANFLEFQGKEYLSSFSRVITSRKQTEQILHMQRMIATTLSEASHIEAAFRQVLITILEIDGLDCGGVYLVDKELHALSLVVQVGFSPEFANQVTQYDMNSPHVQAIVQGRTVYGLHADIAPQMDEVRWREGLHAVVAIPVQNDGYVVAVLLFASHTNDEIPVFTRTALESIAAQIGGSIARLDAANALHQSQMLLQGILDNTRAAIYVKDLHGRYIIVNRYGASLSERVPEDLIGYTDYELFPPKNADTVAEVDREVIATGQSLTTEVAVAIKGEKRTFFANRFPLYDAQGNIFAIGGMSTDITERKNSEELLEQRVRKRTAELIQANRALQAEIGERQLAEEARQKAYRQHETLSQQLRRNRDLLQTILDTIDNGLLLLDRQGMVLTANRAMGRLLGCPLTDLVGHSWAAICQREPVGDQGLRLGFPGFWVLDTLRDGDIRKERAHVTLDAAGPRVLDMQALPIYPQVTSRSGTQYVDQVVLHVIDVTEQLQFEALIRDNERFVAKRQLSQIIAHEVNSPLQAILFSLDMLLRKTDDSEQRTFLLLAQEEIERVGTILHQLKDTYQTAENHRVAVDVNALLERAVLLTTGKLVKHHVVVERDFTEKLPLIHSQADQLMQVLLNLILNAIDAMPVGGTLRLFTAIQPRSDPPMVTIEVADTGVGIPPEVQPRIFAPFFTTKDDGTGLGLTVSNKIITNAGGTIAVQSVPGEMTIFTIHLPIRKGTDRNGES